MSKPVFEYARPLPEITPNNRAFWEAAKRHELVFPQCAKCLRKWFTSGPACPYCMSTQIEWKRASGRGKISSWVIYNKVYFDGFADSLPYNVIQVELEEGPRLTSSLVGMANDQIRYGMDVEVTFDDVTPEISIPKFRPAK